MYCKNCGNQIAEGALFCNQCGAPVNSSSSSNLVPKKKKWLLLVLALIVVMGGGILYMNSGKKTLGKKLTEEEKFIVGEWIGLTSDSTLIFNEDFTGLIIAEDSSGKVTEMKFTWEYDEEYSNESDSFNKYCLNVIVSDGVGKMFAITSKEDIDSENTLILGSDYSKDTRFFGRKMEK